VVWQQGEELHGSPFDSNVTRAEQMRNLQEPCETAFENRQDSNHE
jgi:hypothetical protein